MSRMARPVQGVRSKRILAELNLKYNKHDDKVPGSASATSSSEEPIVSPEEKHDAETTKSPSSLSNAATAGLNSAEKENTESVSLTDLTLVDVLLPSLSESNFELKDDDDKVPRDTSTTNSSIKSRVSSESTKQQTSPCHATTVGLNNAEKENAKYISLTDLTLSLPKYRSKSTSVPSLVQSDTEFFSQKDASNIKVTTGNTDLVKINKERSLSLSDLTSDFQNDFAPVKRSQSLPLLEGILLSGNHCCLNSPSILTLYVSAPEKDVHDIPDSELDLFGDMNENRKRRHVADPSSWKKYKAKRLRMEGKEYLGYTKPKEGKLEHNTPRPARELGPTCSSNFCMKSKLRGCDQFTEEARKQIHSRFWKNMNWDQRKVYVIGLVRRTQTNRKTKSVGESRREGTLAYFLPLSPINEEKIQVCKDMFLNTLSLGAFTVQSWVKKAEFGMTPHQEVLNASRKKTPRTGEERKMVTLENFFRDIPKLPSHYGRKDTAKLFVEPVYHSLKELFDTYKKHCELNEEPQVSRFTFENKFHKMNLSLYTLKKDMCDVCAAHSVGNVNEADYQLHVIRKESARSEKLQDKKKAQSGEFILLTMDLEAVKVCPYLKASALYFKTKLTCHNFTVYNLISNHCTCYWFDETSTDLTASTFASFIIDYLERHCVSQKKPIVIFSDGCTYQNRNVTLSNALLNLSKKYRITITQKYLEPGHTQMECDSVHSAVERKLKNKEIHLPSNYVTITKEARKDPYEVIQAEYNFFKNYADPDTYVYKSIRPGRRPGDALVVDLRALLYSPDSTIKYKINFHEEWSDLPQRAKPKKVLYNQLHPKKLPISHSKFKHLQELKQVLPADCHLFYDNLPHD